MTDTNVDPFPLYPEQAAGRRARKTLSLPQFILNSFSHLVFPDGVIGYFMAVLDGISQTQVQVQLFEITPLAQLEALIFLLLSKYSAVGRTFLYLQISDLEVSVSHSGELKLD